MNDEMNSILTNTIWELTDLSPNAKPIGCKRIFKRKLNVGGSIKKI